MTNKIPDDTIATLKVPYCNSANSSLDPKFEIKEDGIYKTTPIVSIGNNIVKTELILPRDILMEAIEKWKDT